MKKNFVRNLVMAGAVVVAVALGGCSKQEVGVEGDSNLTVENTNYELTEEEKEFVYRLVYAEAMSSDSKLGSEMLCNLALARLDAMIYYLPTPEEVQWAYYMAVAQTQDESPIIQTMGTNVAINVAKANQMSLVDVFKTPNLFSGVHDGVPSLRIEDEDGKVSWIPVTDDMLTDELKAAVDAAFEKDYTDGALHYYNLYSNSKVPQPEEFKQEGDWIFFKEF